jgi:hypothetical protein
MSVSPMWLRCVFTVVGVLLIYLGFTYEPEQRQIQNYFETLWIQIDELRAQGMKVQTAFMHVVAEAISSNISILFGKRLISLQALGTSIGLSGATFSLLSGILLPSADRTSTFRFSLSVLLAALAVIVGTLPRRGRTWFTLLISAMAIVGFFYYWYLLFFALSFVFVAFTIFAARRPNRTQTWFAVTNLLMLVELFFYSVFTRVGFDTPLQFYEIVSADCAVVLIFSFGCDLAFIAATRKILLRIPAQQSFWACLGLLATSLALAGVFVLGIPWLISSADTYVSNYLDFQTYILIMRYRHDTFFGDPGYGLVLANLWDGAVALLFVALALLMFVHRILWRVIARPIYSVASEQLLAHRWKMITTGVLLLTVASSWVRAVVERVENLR